MHFIDFERQRVGGGRSHQISLTSILVLKVFYFPFWLNIVKARDPLGKTVESGEERENGIFCRINKE